MAITQLGTLSREERENYLWKVFREAEDYRYDKEAKILEVFRFVRALKDKNSNYKNDLRHPYAYAAYKQVKAATYPILFSGDPVVQLVDPNPDNYQRNQLAERLLTGLIKNPCLTNFARAFDRTLDDAIWFGYSRPWTYFRSMSRMFEGRFVPQMVDGVLVVGKDEPKEERVYHAPWLEHVDVWDSFLHPDARRSFTRRDVTGYDLIAQAKGANPIYDPERVLRMIRLEANRQMRKMSRDAQPNFHDGSESMRIRDELSAEVGAEPLRHDRLATSRWEKDVLAKPFVIMHYDDGEYLGTYAVASDRSGFMELRFNIGVSYDGEPSTLSLTTGRSPQEIYGTSDFEVGLDLFKLHSKFYQAAGDITALTMNPMWMQSQQMKLANPAGITVGPGAMVTVPPFRQSAEEHLRRLDMPNGAYQPLQFVDYVQGSLDLLMAQSDPVRGIPGGGRKTALETNVLAQGAQGRIEILHTNILNEFAIPLVRKWLAMATEHYTARDYVEMLGVEGATYIPPSRREIIRSLQYVPQGSLTKADSSLRASRWPAVMQTLTQTLPLMQVPHVHEAVKRMLEDMGFEAVSRMIPSADDPRMTEYMAMSLQAMQQAQGMPQQGSPPRSPGDISGALREAGGATAPPGNMNGGTNGTAQPSFAGQPRF